TSSLRGIREHRHSRGAANTGNVSGGTSSIASPGTSSTNHEPLHYTVAFIVSDGTPTAIPTGALVWGTNVPPSGYTVEALTNRVLKGAATATPGGTLGGSTAHNHTVNAHTHTGLGSHTHTVANVLQQGTTEGYRYRWDGSSTTPSKFAGAFPSQSMGATADGRHVHPVTAGSASVGNLNSASGGTTQSIDNRPPTRDLRLLRAGAGPVAVGLVGMWLGDATTLPSTLRRC